MLSYYLELAVRRMRADAGLVALTVMIIALGVGASMAVAALLHGVRAGLGDAGRAQLYHIQLDARPPAARSDHPDIPSGLSYDDAVGLEHALSGQANATMIGGNWLPTAVGEGSSLTMQTVQATDSPFFKMFDAPLRFGTTWSVSDDEARSRVVVLSAQANDRLFHGENSVGKALNIDGTLFRVIGVLAPWNPQPRYFYLGDDPYAPPRDFYMPFATWLALPKGYGYGPMNCWNGSNDSGFDNPTSADCAWIQFWASPLDGQLGGAIAPLVRNYVATLVASGRLSSASDAQMLDVKHWLDAQNLYPPIVRLQFALSISVLVVCLITAGGLLAARFARRRNELALRRALGATRAEVAQQCLIEVAAVGVMAGLLSLVTAWLGILILRSQPASYAHTARLDATMAGLTLAVALVAALISGTLPALRIARQSVFGELKG